MRNSIAFILAVLIIAIVFGVNYSRPAVASGVTGWDGYYATTTGGTTVAGISGGDVLLRARGGGLVGSVVISGAAAGTLALYDATTSDVTKRTGNTASSTLLLAQFPASAGAGTYTYDVNLKTGLLLSTSGALPTSTITWK